MRIVLVISTVAVLLLAMSAAWAQDHDDMDVSDAKVDQKRLKEAIKEGADWLKRKQQANGSLIGAKPQGMELHMPGGATALALFALLKCGVDRNDPIIRNGFKFCFNAPNPGIAPDPNNPGSGSWEHRVYSVSCLILALEARYAPEKKDAPKSSAKKRAKWATTPHEEKIRKNFQKHASPQDKKAMQELVEWLLSQQQTNVWRYPGPAQDGNLEDASNTQYAMLALNSGRRLGFPIQPQVWAKVADYFIKYQQKHGPQVKWFPIPGADFSMSKLKKMAKEVMRSLRKELRKQYASSRGKKGEGEIDKSDLSTSVEIENPYERFGAEKVDMFARGWSYIPEGKAGEFKTMETISGSMTTSGAAALMICKAALEGTPYYRRYEKKINKGIRDGCSWLAHHFTISTNPGVGSYHYYYLYGLERVGVLTLCRMFGAHDWYEKGANHLLAAQKGDGGWSAGGHSSDLVNTCFALLFLKRATTPVVQIPEQAHTGGDLFGGGKHKDK